MVGGIYLKLSYLNYIWRDYYLYLHMLSKLETFSMCVGFSILSHKQYREDLINNLMEHA